MKEQRTDEGLNSFDDYRLMAQSCSYSQGLRTAKNVRLNAVCREMLLGNLKVPISEVWPNHILCL